MVWGGKEVTWVRGKDGMNIGNRCLVVFWDATDTLLASSGVVSESGTQYCVKATCQRVSFRIWIWIMPLFSGFFFFFLVLLEHGSFLCYANLTRSSWFYFISPNPPQEWKKEKKKKKKEKRISSWVWPFFFTLFPRLDPIHGPTSTRGFLDFLPFINILSKRIKW